MPRMSKRELDLITAYRNTFNGKAMKEEAERVLRDLADVSNFYKVSPVDLPVDQLKFVEGGRRVFERIVTCLRMSDAELARLEEAARQEAINRNEGT
jgi:hypothetical protein